jgi:ribosomal protein S18 acetylase RimI-like enzyme
MTPGEMERRPVSDRPPLRNFHRVASSRAAPDARDMSFTFRPVRPTDLDALHALARAIETHDGVPIATPREEFAEWFADPHLNVEADTRLAESFGEPVAWGRIWHRPSGEREERAFLLGGVAAKHRRAGIGSALLTWQIERARALLGDGSAPGALPRYVRAQAYDFQAETLRLYERHGFREVRRGEEMVRELAMLPDAIVPDGIELVPWNPARGEEARLVTNAAFADHWTFTPRDAAAWAHELAAFGKRLDLSCLALDAGRVVGVCRNAHFPDDEAVTGRRDGWIDQVSVLRSHRGRGIASALITRSLGVFRDASFTHAMLGVDRDNPTGAYALYERLGFRTLSRLIVHQLMTR